MVIMLILFLLLFPFTVSAGAHPPLGVATERGELHLTLYNSGPAFLTEYRQVDLAVGENRIVLQDLVGQITPGSFFVDSASEGTAIVEQSLQPANLSGQRIAASYLGKQVQAVRTNPSTGEDSFEAAILTGINDGYILQFNDRLETSFPGRLVFPSLPAGLSASNTAQLTVIREQQGKTELMLGYMAELMNWQADYIGIIEAGDTSLALSGWALVTNSSTESIDGAAARFVAGNPHRNLQPIAPRLQRMEASFDMAQKAGGMPPDNFSEYYLYRLDRPFSIEPGEQKRFALFPERRVPFDRQYVLLPGNYQQRPTAADDEVMKSPVEVFVQLRNTEAGSLGLPLPGGQIRFFEKDERGSLLFAGEDRIAAASAGDTVKCSLGQSFDVKAERQQIAFVLLPSENRGGYAYESTRRIKLFNRGKNSVTVKVVEQIYGDWRILEENLDHEARSAGQVFWQVPVAADSEALLQYKVRVKER